MMDARKLGFDDESEMSVADLSLYFAYMMWRKGRRAKRGLLDQPSSRERAFWLKHKAIPAAQALIINAAKELPGLADAHVERVLRAWMLERIYNAPTTLRGRPKKSISLMDRALASAKVKRGPGRPSLGSTTEAAQWVAFMTGLKLRLFAEVTPDDSRIGSTAGSILARVRRAAMDACGRDEPQATLDFLNTSISDARAVRDSLAQRFGPAASAATLAKRLQRARKRHPFMPAALKPEI